jgi:uncharacterized integral membrane protein (TIGR00698 family)
MSTSTPPHAGSGALGQRLRGARSLLPGLVIAGLVALSASWLSEHYHAPVMLFALLLGVALLGMRITFGQVESLGIGPLLLTAAAVALTILFGWLLVRYTRLGEAFGVLTGGAVAICGASAALAIAAVLPKGPTHERDTVMTVVAVTTLSTIAMIFYPLIAHATGLDAHASGIFLGATIHDVAQVVGAGYSVSTEAGDTATIVKLFRIALLLPVVQLISLRFRGRAGGGEGGARTPCQVGYRLLPAGAWSRSSRRWERRPRSAISRGWDGRRSR